MTSKREERAIRSVLTTNYAELSTRIDVANPLKLGEKLMADQIVTSAQFSAIQHHDRQSFASELVGSAKPLLELESGKFKKFLRILLDDVACFNVGRKICKDMGEEGFSEYLNILEDFDNKPKSQPPEDRNSIPPGKSERGATGKIQVDGEEEASTPTGGVPSGQAGHLPSHSAHTDNSQKWIRRIIIILIVICIFALALLSIVQLIWQPFSYWFGLTSSSSLVLFLFILYSLYEKKLSLARVLHFCLLMSLPFIAMFAPDSMRDIFKRFIEILPRLF